MTDENRNENNIEVLEAAIKAIAVIGVVLSIVFTIGIVDQSNKIKGLQSKIEVLEQRLIAD